ncbi:LPS-assembly protein LptD [Treponema sp. OttesenSCG-928-L16]|nr:LPS-assembly protein LptD [Treponema sp. OttesenSCG-928-L16]
MTLILFRNLRFFLLYVLVSALGLTVLYGQSGELPDGEDALDGGAAEAPQLSVLELDIRTSSLSELAIWSRELGLSEGGTKEDLANRLRGHYGLPSPDGASLGEGADKTVVIESARDTEYFTLEVVDEEYARLRGDVLISLKDGNTVHRIKAWEILYNRTRNIMSASGNVEYIREDGDTIETFRGENISVNLDTWETVFMGGSSERSLSDDETAYRFSGTVISRSDEEVTVLTQAEITNAKNEESYWSLHASKLWLMPGSDWAILNAVLKVGEIPVLYIPFFYLPGDELIFHPVLGYRSREGSFVQTTTYLLGRPKADSSKEQSSITKILGNNKDMERTREGLFLRSTGRKAQDENKPTLSLLFDAYTNLGFYIGTEATIPKSGIFGATEISAGIGFTRDVHQISTTYYTPFAKFDGSSNWNSSRLFSFSLPFRYRLNAKGSLSGNWGSFSWLFPFYSDPYVDKDFLNRSEEVDWFNMIKEGAAAEDDLAYDSAISSYEWRFNGSFSNIPVTRLSPYLSSFSISSISTTLSFKTRTSASITSDASPDRLFFYPDKLTIYSLSASLSGKPFSYNESGKSSESAENEGPDPLWNIGVPRSPWDEGEEAADTAGSGQVSLSPPVLAQTFSLSSSSRTPSVDLDYRLTPTSATEMQFRSSSAHWKEAKDVDWGDLSSILTTIRGDGNVGLTVTDPGSIYSASLRLSGTAAWRDYLYINDEAEEFDTAAEKDALKLNAYNATFFTTSSEFAFTLKPFIQSAVWSSSNFSYSLKGLLAKSVFDGSAGDPSWNMEYGSWSKEDIETHKVTANMNASVRDKQQTLTLSADIPPEDADVSGNAVVRVWRTETSVSSGIQDIFDDPLYESVRITETIDLGTSRSFRQNIIFDPELGEFTSMTSSLTLWGFSTSFTAAHSRRYELIPGSGWKLTQDPARLNPREFKMGYNKTFSREAEEKKLVSWALTVNTNLAFDLQRYTYSSFTFSLGTTLKINNFLDLTFATTSENSVIFRYFQSLPFFDLPITLPGEQNVFTDLVNSFRFDDPALRRSSGFKLKSMTVSATHYLGDWEAVLGLKLSPYLDTNAREYKFNTEISFIVRWLPISEIKTEISYDKDEFVFK